MTSVFGFAAVECDQPRLLVLGTFPGPRSLSLGEYYAHPGNRFWPTVGAILGFAPPTPYPDRLSALRRAGIALWDVLAACDRQGAADDQIDVETSYPNDFAEYLARHPTLRTVCFNGRRAAVLFDRLVLTTAAWPDCDLAFRVLPSTSSANAGLPAVQLADIWRTSLAP